MKTKHINITNRPAKKLRCILAAFITWILPALILIATIEFSFADSGTWLGDPTNGDWNFTLSGFTNWTGNVIPNGPADTATFASSSSTSVFLSAGTRVNGIVFNPGASAFTIIAGPGFALTISGVGITNNSGTTQNFVTNGGAVAGVIGGLTQFNGTSTAANGTFINNGGMVANPDRTLRDGGLTLFNGTSTAANGTFINNGGMVAKAGGGHTQFNGTSTAANGTFINNGGAVFGAAIGETLFFVNSTAENGTFINNGGAVFAAGGGITEFHDTSKAGSGTFTNNGGMAAEAGGGTTEFFNTSTADSATLIANGGSDGGFAGRILFHADSRGGTARVEVFGNGNLGISDHNATPVTIGSIEGDGNVFLGANNLTVGSNNVSTVFSGVMDDEVGGVHRNGSLTKVGTGTLTLTGTNTYTGPTTISAGGTLQLGTSGSIVGDVVNNATFAINRSDMFTFGGVISGAGAFQQLGTGTTILTGTNTYSGGTTISTGTLQLGNGGTSGSIVGDVVNNATFAVNRSDMFTFGGVISGAGAFQQLGTGTTVLTGANTYTGITAISAGVLSISSDSNLGTAPGAPVADQLTLNGGTLQVTASFALDTNRGITLLGSGGTIGVTAANILSYGGVITGTGSLTKTDTGTLVLSGVNTYTGATTVNGGTLAAGAINTVPSQTALTVATGAIFDLNNFSQSIGSLAGAGSVTLGTATLITGDDNTGTDFSGVISGGGSLTKVGTGTLTLTGLNTYDGITAINAGVLSISSDANLGTAPGAPVANQLTFNGGRLQVTASFALDTNRGITLLGGGGTIGVTAANILSYGGVITGTGSLTKTDTGTLVLSGVNTYTGATTVNGGTLAAGAINTVPSQTALTVATGAIFDLNNFSQSIGSLSGAGSVTLGTATLTTGNDNTSTDFSGVISGLGGLTKVGTATQTLSGENTYAGVTVVNGGSLIVDGSIASAQTFVNPGGLLGGQGFLGGNLRNAGIVSPGNSPGTLTVNGNYTQNANGTLRIEIAGLAPTAHDLLAINGTANLAGTLQVIRLNNFTFSPDDQITFLTANGGVNGTFNPVINPFAMSGTIVAVQIVYLGNSVGFLAATQGSFTAVACNPNTLAVANALDSAVGDPHASGLIEFLDMQPLSELCGDLELIAPEELPAMFNIGVSLANIQSVNLARRMEDIRAGSSGFSATGFTINTRGRDFSQGLAGPTGPEGKSGPSVMQPTPQNRWGVFVTGLGEFTDVDSTSVAPGYNFSTGGLTFGVDYRVSPNFAIGLTGGYANTNANLVNNGSLDVNGGTIGAYATGFGGGFYVNAAAFGVFNGYDSHRTALLGTASGDTDGQDFNALVEAGYDWKRGGLSIGPLASFQYTYVGLDGFTEHGSLAPLSFNNQNTESTRTALGAKASYEWHVGNVVVKPEVRAAWQHEFGDTDYSIASRFASGAGNSFTVNGPAIGRDSLLIGAGAAVLLNDRVSVYAYYDGELARTNYSSNNVSAGVRFTF